MIEGRDRAGLVDDRYGVGVGRGANFQFCTQEIRGLREMFFPAKSQNPGRRFERSSCALPRLGRSGKFQYAH